MTYFYFYYADDTTPYATDKSINSLLNKLEENTNEIKKTQIILLNDLDAII